MTQEARDRVTLRIKINGTSQEANVEARTLLVHLLRDRFGLKGAHIGCDTTNCGACTVLLDGRPVKSCTVLAAQADGGEVTTIEGLSPDGGMHPVQDAFLKEHGLQCGYCTPGMVLTAAALLTAHPHPTEEEIRAALSGNLCRCTGYAGIVRSVQRAAKTTRAAGRRRSR